MALIKCPECGRENVSSTAESCPNCGYGVKAHFERIEKQKAAQIIQQQKEATKISRQAEADKKYTEYLHAVKQEQQQIDNISAPKKPNYFIELFRKDIRALTLLIVVGPILTLLFCVAAQVDAFILVLYAALGLIATPVWLIICFVDFHSQLQEYKKELNLYNTNRKEWERQKEQKKANIETKYRAQAKADIDRKYNPPAPVQTNSIKCPVCGSANIEKITTMDRSFSIAMVGMASGKIGKQYKCKNCKHMW